MRLLRITDTTGINSEKAIPGESDTWDIELVEPPIDNIPQYAILSHTWSDDEVTFADMQGDPARYKAKQGWSKIEATCKQALRDGLRHAWCDTCCINKESSAELSEAINSMYAWYASAKRCYAYLADVSESAHQARSTTELNKSQFASSRWFRRGWTLQELIAPYEVEFFGRDWKPLSTKRTITDHLQKITGIETEVLLDRDSIHEVSVAQRMSWAANRQTTRIEDMAYCLLGLFDVSMPLIYGEGKRSFIRLQEEIIKTSDDQSIFAWLGTHQSLSRLECGLLASGPRAFSRSGNVETFRDWSKPTEPYTLTNAGLSIQLSLQANFQNQEYIALLNCVQKEKRVVLKLKCVSETANQFVRIISLYDILTPDLDLYTGQMMTRKILVRQRQIRPHVQDVLAGTISIKPRSANMDGYSVVANMVFSLTTGEPKNHYRGFDIDTQKFLLPAEPDKLRLALLMKSPRFGNQFLLVLAGTKGSQGRPIPRLKAYAWREWQSQWQASGARVDRSKGIISKTLMNLVSWPSEAEPQKMATFVNILKSSWRERDVERTCPPDVWLDLDGKFSVMLQTSDHRNQEGEMHGDIAETSLELVVKDTPLGDEPGLQRQRPGWHAQRLRAAISVVRVAHGDGSKFKNGPPSP